MPTNLRDFLEHLGPQETGVIPYWDGCNRVPISIPSKFMTCKGVRSCIDCEFISGLLDFSSNSLIWNSRSCALSVNPSWLNKNIMAAFDCDTLILTIGSNTIDLSCILLGRQFSFTDGTSSQVVTNLGSVTLNGRDGLGFRLGNGGLNVSLPNPRIHGQVLTWSDTLNAAYWENPMTVCCDWVYGCMEPIIAGLQNQINILAGQLCPCGAGEGTPLSVYEEGLLVMGSVSMINIIGACLTATANIGTNHMVDITLDISATYDNQTNALIICGNKVDLSPLVRGGFGVYQDETLVSLTQNINFNDYLVATRNAVTSMVDVSVNIPVTFSGCNGETPYQLSVGGTVVDLSCLVGSSACPCPIEVDQETFVMENGNDSTGTIGRFDLPYRTLRAAVLAGAKNIIMYAGSYTETNDIIINNVAVSIFAHPNVSFMGSFDMRGNTASLKIDGYMNRVKPANQHPTYGPYIIMGNSDGTSPAGYNVDININRIDLSRQKLLWNFSKQEKISFNFVAKRSTKRYQYTLAEDTYMIDSTNYYIPEGTNPPESCDANRLATRQINISLGYLSIVMSGGDTITEYTPYVNIIKCGLGNNIRLFDTTLQESIETINNPGTQVFGSEGIVSKCGQIRNIIGAGSYVELDKFNIVGRFTAQGFDYDTPEASNAMFQMMGSADTSVARLMFRNCNFLLSKTREAGRTYRLVQSKVYNDDPEGTAAGFVEFDGVNTFYESKSAISEFEYSLPANDGDTYMAYYANSGFLVTNMMIQLSPQALDPAKHVHGGVEHIVCTLHEPYSTLFEPIIHIDHSI